jgi:multidrug efflux pump subunit AcrA (membrane-fusion protein)
MGAIFQRKVLRLPVEVPALSRRKRRIFWIYGVLALAYTALIMRFIGGLFFNFYSKILPDFAVILLLLTLARIFRKRLRLVSRTGRLFYLDKKELLMSRRYRVYWALAAAVVALVLFVPWSRRTISAEAELQPARVARIEAPEDARVVEVLADESAEVAAGAPVFRMASPAAGADSERASRSRERFLRAARDAKARGSAPDASDADARRSAADSRVESETVRTENLLVRSPFAGRILTPRLRDLDQRFVHSGLLLAQVGDCSRLIAELPVSERRIGDVAIGAPVKALVPQRPLSPIHGRIERVSLGAVDRPSTASGLSDPAAPPERPERFVAVAVFENADGSLKPGDLVRAKISGPRISYASRAGRVLWRWIQSIVW